MKRMPSQEEIDEQRELLAVYRKTLLFLLKQRAQHTEAYMPPAIEHGVLEARDNIRRRKEILHAWGIVVEDHPDDTDPVKVARLQLTSSRLTPKWLVPAMLIFVLIVASVIWRILTNNVGNLLSIIPSPSLSLSSPNSTNTLAGFTTSTPKPSATPEPRSTTLSPPSTLISPTPTTLIPSQTPIPTLSMPTTHPTTSHSTPSSVVVPSATVSTVRRSESFSINITDINTNGPGDTCTEKSNSEIYAGVFNRDGQPIENALVRIEPLGRSDVSEARTDAKGLVVRKGLSCAAWIVTLVEVEERIIPETSITLSNVINGNDGTLATVEFRQRGGTSSNIIPFSIAITSANTDGGCTEKSNSEIYAGVFNRDGQPIENALVRIEPLGRSDVSEARTDAKGLVVRKGLSCAAWIVTLVKVEERIIPETSITLSNVINGNDGTLATVEFKRR